MSRTTNVAASRPAAHEEVRTTVERQILDERTPRSGGRIGRVLRVVEIIEATIGGLLLLAILVLVMIQVTVRFTSLHGWVWTGELARFSLVWMAFILAGYLLGRDQQITLNLVDHLLSDRGRRVVEIFAYLVVAAVCAAFVREGLGLIDAQSGIRSSSAEIPMSVVYAIPTVGFALTGVRALIGPFARKDTA
jgi:TRAP-type C4-dicarboxylate transport system permease small subunit